MSPAKYVLPTAKPPGFTPLSSVLAEPSCRRCAICQSVKQHRFIEEIDDLTAESALRVDCKACQSLLATQGVVPVTR